MNSGWNMQLLFRKYNLFIIFGFFVILFNPPLISFNTMHIVGVVSLIYLAVNYYTKISGIYLEWIKFYLFILVYLILDVIVLHGGAASGVVYPVYFLLDIIPFSCAINIYIQKRKISTDDLMVMVFLAALIQAIFAFIAFTNPQFQSFVIKRIISYGGIETYNYWSTLRMYGFSNGLMFEMPVIQSVLSIVALYYSMNKGKKYYLLIAGILFFSAIINGRVSFIVVLVGLFTLVLIGNQSPNKKIQIIVGSLLLLFVLIAFFLPYTQENAPLTYKWITEGIEDIVGIINRDTSSGYYSYISNSDKYRLPESALGLLFGEGISVAGGNNVFNMSSDIGFINDIWIGGVTYLILEYFMFAKRIIVFIRNNKQLPAFIGIFSMLLVIILNFKGCIFTMNSFMNFTVIMSIIFGVQDSDEITKND